MTGIYAAGVLNILLEHGYQGRRSGRSFMEASLVAALWQARCSIPQRLPPLHMTMPGVPVVISVGNGSLAAGTHLVMTPLGFAHGVYAPTTRNVIPCSSLKTYNGQASASMPLWFRIIVGDERTRSCWTGFPAFHLQMNFKKPGRLTHGRWIAKSQTNIYTLSAGEVYHRISQEFIKPWCLRCITELEEEVDCRGKYVCVL